MIVDSDGNSYDDLTSWHLNSPSNKQEDEQDTSSNGHREIYFVRHGDTDLNEESSEHSDEQPVRGHSPVPLNQDGIKQAQKAAESVKDLPIEHIVASDLPRAAQTARIIGNKINVPVEYDPGLRTWDLGAYTGKAGKEIHDAVDRLCTEAQDERPPSGNYPGESFNEFKNRILSTVSNITQKHQDKELLLVSHNSPERVLHAWTEAGQPQKNLLSQKLKEVGEEPVKPQYDTQGFDLDNRETGVKPLNLLGRMINPFGSDEAEMDIIHRKEIDEKHDELQRGLWKLGQDIEKTLRDTGYDYDKEFKHEPAPTGIRNERKI